jgi:predicted nucleic acid-binding protein
VLECADAVDADFIVTGDKHLLFLKHFQNTNVIKLSDFLKKF